MHHTLIFKLLLAMALINHCLHVNAAELTPEVEFSLQGLLDDRFTLEQLYDEGSSIETLENYLPPKELKKLYRNGKYRKKISKLKETEAKLIRAGKRAEKGPRRNKSFFGDPSNAMDANEEELQQYDFLIETLNNLKGQKELSEDLYENVSSILDDLRFFHANNVKICQEYAFNTKSETYDDSRLALHPEGQQTPFELKATVLFNLIQADFEDALQNDWVCEFFKAYDERHGCLEARVEAGHSKYQRYAKAAGVSSNPYDADSSIYNAIQERQDYWKEVDSDDKEAMKKAAFKILKSIKNKFGSTYDKDNKRITFNNTLNKLAEVMTAESNWYSPMPSPAVTPNPTPKTTPTKKPPTGSSPRFGKAKKLSPRHASARNSPQHAERMYQRPSRENLDGLRAQLFAVKDSEGEPESSALSAFEEALHALEEKQRTLIVKMQTGDFEKAQISYETDEPGRWDSRLLNLTLSEFSDLICKFYLSKIESQESADNLFAQAFAELDAETIEEWQKNLIENDQGITHTQLKIYALATNKNIVVFEEADTGMILESERYPNDCESAQELWFYKRKYRDLIFGDQEFFYYSPVKVLNNYAPVLRVNT